MVSKELIAALAVLLGTGAAQTRPHTTALPKAETAHLLFVKEYVREMISDEDLKTSAEKELAGAKSVNEQLSTGIYFSKSVQLELRAQIGVLKGMRLKAPYDDLTADLIAFYQQEIDLHQKLIDLNTAFIEGPKPGVDYSPMAAKMPQIRAELESIQKGVFEAAALVFMTLIDLKPDSQGHLSHLVITKTDKADLQDQLNIMLSGQSDHGDHDYYISAAMVIRGGLNKGHKCADEPWD